MDEGVAPTPKVVERLDVEDEEERQARIQTFLEKLNSSAYTTHSTNHMHTGVPKYDFGDRTTFPFKPPTELLSRVQAFLPQLEASNTLLAQRMQEDPASIDIEHIPEGMDQYIEMNLGLGLFEDKSKRADHKRGNDSEDSEMSTSSSSSSDSLDRERDDDDDSEEYDSDESSIIITSFVPSRPVRPLPRRASTNPKIVVLGEEDS